MKQIFIILLIFTTIIYAKEYEKIMPVDGDDSNDNNAIKPDDNSSNDVKQPRSNRKICDVCTCDNKKKILDCSDLNMRTMFTGDEWATLDENVDKYEIVRFCHNMLTDIPAFPNLTLKVLDLSHNQISSIADSAFANLTNLDTLILSHNLLNSTSIQRNTFEGHFDPTLYEPLKQLRVLDLSNNNFHTLKVNVFNHLPNLEDLHLDMNPFKIIDQSTELAIGDIAKLKFLDLSYMELSSLPLHIFHSPRGLEVLNLTGNLFTTIPNALDNAINLKALFLDENPILSIVQENKFGNLLKLETLSISYMQVLETIGQGGLSGLHNLNTLYCTNNPKLTSLHAGAMSRPGSEETSREEWPPMKNLYLHNTALTYLDSHLIGRWDDMEIIDIRSDMWSCDCDNQWMIDVILKSIEDHTPQLAEGIICGSPSEMKDVKMVDIERKHLHMRCLDRYGNRPERDGMLLINLLVGILIGIPIALGLVVIYRRGCFGMISPRGPADYSRAFYKRTGQNDDFHI